MKRHYIFAKISILLGLLASFSLPLPALAATVALANAPLATATSTTVKPNLLFIFDNSGSMAREYMPDDANDFSGRYGINSSQCNGVYYDPTITYQPPVKSDKTSYANANFTAALNDGYDTSTTPSTTNLNNSAFYYDYSGSVTDKDYLNTSSPFYTECRGTISTPSNIFSKRRLSSNPTTTIVVSNTSSASTVTSITVCSQGTAPVCSVNLLNATSASASSNNDVATNIAAQINAKTSTGYAASVSGSTVTITPPTNGSALNRIPVIVKTGSATFATDVFPDTTASKLTNYANWYTYYRSRILMMKTAAGQAFSNLGDSYRVGLSVIYPEPSDPIILDELATFETTNRDDWYSKLYGIQDYSNTPLRKALSNAGRYYAGKLSSTTDPVQYSCQQNFTILSTDGYWNGDEGFLLDGSTPIGNQDSIEDRAKYDGSTLGNTWTFTYTRNTYRKISAGCSGSNKRLETTPQTGSCTRTASTGSCTPTSWNDGTATISGTCNKTAAPATSAAVLASVVQNSAGGASDTLADVAQYYYKTDLRTPALGNCGTAVSPATVGPLCENNVFKSATDSLLQQHMTTFTLGLGASGRMRYSAGYTKDGNNPDYDAVELGSIASATVCNWQTAGTVCNWPVPSSGAIENIDDLWHAAVNGRGVYFSATNPDTLSSGLSSALAGINAKKGAAAAAASSTLNPVAGNNFAYVASYTTVDWRGNLEARGINTDTGIVSENATWCLEDVTPTGSAVCATALVPQLTGDTTIYNCETANSGSCPGGVIADSGNATTGTAYCKVQFPKTCTGTMNSRVAATSDTRIIKTANSAGTALIDFDDAYAAANSTYFDAAKLAGLSQWASLDSVQKAKAAGGFLADGTTAATGSNLVKYLRGQFGYEDRTDNDGPPDNRLYRSRSAVIGDALESQPAFMGKPVFSYPYPGYSDYKTAEASRSGTVYMGTNDGMMHAIASADGVERWAYVPSMVIPNMWKLADLSYASLHVNFVNGSPITSDICVSNTTTTLANCNNTSYATTASTSDDPVWKTILVAGLNGGGRGYYALDITNPTSPVLLWEFTTTDGIGKVKDADLGYSYGQPIVTKRADGKWVVLVTSGYNNVGPGDGKGYLYVLDAYDGTILSKISTGAGDTTTPSGLAKIAGYNKESSGNSIGYVYGGDLQGGVWRFDINNSTTAAIGTGAVKQFAKLYSDTAGTLPQPVTTTPVLGKIAGSSVIFVGTGKYLEVGDLTNTQQQTQYAIKDDNSSTLVNPRTTLVSQTIANNPDGTASRLIATTSPVNFSTGRGWFVDFPSTSIGERVNIDSALVQGVLLVPTIVPSNTACSPGGSGWLNFLDYKTGGSTTSSGLVSAKYDSTIVGVNVFYIDGEPVVGVVTSTDPTPKKDDDVTFPASAGNFSGKRSLWRELFQ